MFSLILPVFAWMSAFAESQAVGGLDANDVSFLQHGLEIQSQAAFPKISHPGDSDNSADSADAGDVHDAPTAALLRERAIQNVSSARQQVEFEASSGMLSAWEDAFEENPALFEGCANVFIDVGANRGTHVRKLFEPEKYPDSPYLSVFDASFGTTRSRPFSETGICAFGFEANPRWAPTLKGIEEAYGVQGWRARFFSPEAVSDKSGNITFWLNDDSGENSDWGASMVKHDANATRLAVPAIDLSDFMQKLSAHAPPGYKLMKMDIEGAEYMVVPKLLETGVLCESALDKLTIEWHPRLLSTDADPAVLHMRQQLMNSTRCGEESATVVVNLDDESYLKDGKPLP